MTELERAFAEFEAGFTVVEGRQGRSQTDQRYREFLSEKRATESETIADLVSFARAYAARTRGHTIYWRFRPEMKEFKGGYRGYMRLLITDRPVIERLARAA